MRIVSRIFIENLLFLKWSVWPFAGTLTGTHMPCQSGPGSNGNKGVLHTSKISITGFLPSDAVLCNTLDTYFRGGLWYNQCILSPVDNVSLNIRFGLC